MPAIVTYLDPQPRELPDQMPSPFAAEPPHPVAQAAAEQLQRELQGGLAARLGLDTPGGGKMFGVLVVADRDGRVGFVRAFSGMASGRWDIDGFAPPVFDVDARDAFWPAGERELGVIANAIRAIDERAAPLRAALDALSAEQQAALTRMRDRHRDTRASRHAARAALEAGDASDRPSHGDWLDAPSNIDASQRDALHGLDPRIGGDMAERRNFETSQRGDGQLDGRPGGDASQRDALHALDQQSRGDTAERRTLDASQRAARESMTEQLRAVDAERAALEAQRAGRSRHFLHRIYDTYVLVNARGQARAMRELFAPDEPPGGSGDCAAPKLLAFAYRNELRPIALAEFWCGTPPVTGGRHSGVYYPACRGKCGPILAHMLDGLDAEPPPIFGDAPIAADEPRTIFEDQWLVVVAKPVGLLSVPGRSGALRDSVLTRLRARYPAATGPLVVHRLDLDTSGLLLAAKDSQTHRALQAQFARHEIAKRYVAWLDGDVIGEAGRIELALRVDLDDRPRQIYDPVHGKPAMTEWQVLERREGRTRVALVPLTGRAHQLRVHAVHPLGLGVPIVGDRLYGRRDEPKTRLMLHAEALAFVHPHTHERLVFECSAPF